MTATSIVRQKITLDDVKPIVMRRITMRFGVRLDRLHTIVQAAMGWSNSHLWEFRAGGIGWGPSGPDAGFGDGPLDARKAPLLRMLNDVGGKTIKYLYDFGDGWEHSIKIERIFPDVPGLDQPFLLEATGRCPPEDIGGPGGYMAFLELSLIPCTAVTPNSPNVTALISIRTVSTSGNSKPTSAPLPSGRVRRSRRKTGGQKSHSFRLCARRASLPNSC